MSVLTDKCRCNSFGRIDGGPEDKENGAENVLVLNITGT